jgi:signal peptidase I
LKRSYERRLIESMQLAKTTEKANPNSMNYLGSSMNPALKPGDWLQVAPYNGQELRAGDVIVFIPSGSESRIVHRVVSIGSQGIKTRGDNNYDVDKWILRPDQILGRVVYARRGNRQRRVFGGSLGHLLGVTVRAINAIDQRVSALLHPSYEWSARAGMFRRLLPAQMTPRVISFSRPEGTELQLLIGRWVIGRRLPGKSGWNIRRPYRLFVDEASLPGNPARGSVVRSPSSVVDEV